MAAAVYSTVRHHVMARATQHLGRPLCTERAHQLHTCRIRVRGGSLVPAAPLTHRTHPEASLSLWEPLTTPLLVLIGAVLCVLHGRNFARQIPRLASERGEAVAPNRSSFAMLATAGDTGGSKADVDLTIDPMKRDRKVLPLSGSKVVVPFLATIFIKLPLLGLLLPTTVVYRLLSAPFRPKPKQEDATVATVADIPAGVKPLQERPYDLVLIGATGFTGRLAALYLARKYGTDVKWAIAGRQKSKLEKLREELTAINSELKNLPIIVADVTNDQQLPAITNESRVVLTTAGPFELYGHSLVRSCALYGTSYCDITGEFPWVRKTVDQFDDVARHTGARIVHFCGCDCVPTDLLAQGVANALKGEVGESLARIDFYDEIKGGFSGGTVATMSKALHTAQVQYHSDLGYDPLVKDRDGKKSDNQVKSLLSSLIHYSSQFSRWTGPFVMSQININCFRRSNALNGYSQSVKWNESVVFPNLFAAASTMADQLLFFCMVACKPLSFLLPKPGEGPSEAAMAKGFLKLTAYGVGDQGGKVRGVLYYPDDVGYSSTGRMLVEAGMALLTPEVSTTGGVFTPASCQGSVLLKRLVDTGCWYRMEARA